MLFQSLILVLFSEKELHPDFTPRVAIETETSPVTADRGEDFYFIFLLQEIQKKPNLKLNEGNENNIVNGAEVCKAEKDRIKLETEDLAKKTLAAVQRSCNY